MLKNIFEHSESLNVPPTECGSTLDELESYAGTMFSLL